MSTRWYPKTLPCNVSLATNGSAVMVDCTEEGLLSIPSGIPGNATNLTLTINHIPELNSTSFRGLENLTEIDMRCNCVPIKIGPKDRRCTKGLVIMENTFSDLKKLKALYLDGNQLDRIPRGLPPNLILLSLEVNHIYYISKENLSEIRNVEIIYLGAQRGRPVLTVDMLACQYNYLSILLYILLTSTLLSFVTLAVSSHLFLWDVWYIYHFCVAKLKGYGRRSSPQSCPYDAFVVYEKRDQAVSEWVMNELCVQLEERGDRPLRLCLEERDWIPGCPLVDNLCQSIHQSKRTVFVLTNRDLKSGNFKTAFYMAHQRLMDEKNDVIVLIFLEKAACYSKYLRLRKRLYSRSVMEWPTNPQAQPYFWFGLRSNVYDVFVTYDTKDPWVSEWVLEKLRVKLEDEGEKALPLCLEERDWPPGTPLIDNLTHSIRYSRKTLFVLTKAYAKTGAFRLAMYLAHQRLLDENLDVIVVLMLEPVLQHSHFLRLRRRLCGESIVEWPRTAAAEPWFWQNLRNVVRVDNQMLSTSTYSQYFPCSQEKD
ncbi:unnamed protein product [Merluccius merluccius]